MQARHRLCDGTLIEITARTILSGLSEAEQTESLQQLDTPEKRQKFAENLQNTFAPVLRQHSFTAQAAFALAVTAKLYLILDYSTIT
jgi:hypothetical protein